MKTRLILFISIAAVVTLSFTFASVQTSKPAKVENTSKNEVNEPAGGFISEEKL